jgi:thioredoxin 1
MKKYALLVLPVLLFLTACGQKSAYKVVDARQFQKLVTEEKGIVIDVRTESEFSNGHIANAGNLNIYAPDFKSKLLLLPKDQPIYLYCLSGNRSQAAAKILSENGYTQVYNLQGGIMEWNVQNLPLITESNAKPDTENGMEPEQFASLIRSDELVFVDFYATWCGPCRKMMPMIDALKEEYKGKVSIIKVNVDASKNLTRELKLNSVPSFALYRKGELLFSKSGTVTREELTEVFQANMNGPGGK